MKRLVVSYDGTWNNPDQENNGVPSPTNVFKLHNALEQGDEQLRYYHPGLGGEGGLLKPIVSGALGVGIKRHVCSGYQWLARNYEQGDQIFLFGFSRGAFTARSLGGLLGQGLLNLSGLSSKAAWERVHQHYDNRRERKQPAASWKFFHPGKAAPVYFIGVWDTVGALGIPDDLEVLNVFDNPDKWRFHDNALGEYVKSARHAIAIDEVRASFTATRWSNAKQHSGDVEEKWFPGAHSDVGGGYAETDLSNIALRWMMEEAQAKGLVFRDGVIEAVRGNPLGVLHNSFKGLFAKMRSRPRNLPPMLPTNRSDYHPSALERQAASPIEHPPYHPTKVLDVGESVTVDVFASERWNAMGLYLKRGHHYIFSASGEWKDSRDACDWRGTQNDEFTVGDVVRGASSLWGTVENLFRDVTDNDSTDFVMTKRVENLNWFTMVGAICNDSGSERAVKNDGSPTPHQYVNLPKFRNKPLKVSKPGYLYCFPNDVWSLYGNNAGSIQLTIKRVK
jgi:hypothetical protein